MVNITGRCYVAVLVRLNLSDGPPEVGEALPASPYLSDLVDQVARAAAGWSGEVVTFAVSRGQEVIPAGALTAAGHRLPLSPLLQLQLIDPALTARALEAALAYFHTEDTRTEDCCNV